MKKILLLIASVIISIGMNAQVVKVYENGTLAATYTNSETNQYKVVFDKVLVELGKTGESSVSKSAGIPGNKVQWVQLWEDGPRWAVFNVGAKSESESGGLYEWGLSEVQTKENYRTYCQSTTDIQGTTDDTAKNLWGDNWLMPTYEDYKNLISKCDSKTTTQNGLKGMLFTCKDNYSSISLFLPAAGHSEYGTVNEQNYYWSSTPPNSNKAFMLCFEDYSVFTLGISRFYGSSVRAILRDDIYEPVINVYENGTLTATYTNTVDNTYKVVFEEDPDSTNLLPGKFSVSATKKVQFTKSNLYWNGSDFRFEENQTDYQTSWKANHVSHFFWTNLTDYQSGTAAYMPYASSYSCSSQSTNDKFWCGNDNPLTVEGSSGLYALTGRENGEWYYLLRERTNASSLCKYGVTVTNGGKSYGNCLIIAPDDFTGTLQSSYTLDEVNAAGLVCLPAAGYRKGTSFDFVDRGFYWSASNANTSSIACSVYFPSNYVETSTDNRNSGCCIRLVK